MDMSGFARTGGPQIVDRFGRALSGIQSGFRNVAYLTAAAGNNTITLGAIPVRGSLSITKNGSPATYTKNSPLSYKFTSALAAGDVVVVEYMATTNVQATTTLSTILGGGASILAKLSAWWDLSEASGNRADATGNGYTMVPDSGAVSTGNGPRGPGDTCVSLSGSGGLVATSASGDDLDVPSPIDDFCWFGWFNQASSAVKFLLARWDAITASTLSYYTQVGSGYTAYAGVGGGGYNNTTSTISFASAAWHFAVAWFDSSDNHVRLRIDDASETVSTFTYTPSQRAMNLCLGRSNYSTTFQAFNGLLSRWGYIKGDKLTPAEITWLYNSGSGRNFSEL